MERLPLEWLNDHIELAGIEMEAMQEAKEEMEEVQRRHMGIGGMGGW